MQHQDVLERFKNTHDKQALDIACGRGRNSVFLLQNNFSVTAVDISDVGLAALRDTCKNSPKLSLVCHDLDQGLPQFTVQFDVILKIRFLNLSILPALCSYLKPGGLLFIEVLMQTDEGDTAGPKASRFRADPGALREALADVNILHYHEGPITDPDGKTSVVAQAIAQRCE